MYKEERVYGIAQVRRYQKLATKNTDIKIIKVIPNGNGCYGMYARTDALITRPATQEEEEAEIQQHMDEKTKVNRIKKGFYLYNKQTEEVKNKYTDETWVSNTGNLQTKYPNSTGHIKFVDWLATKNIKLTDEEEHCLLLLHRYIYPYRGYYYVMRCNQHEKQLSFYAPIEGEKSFDNLLDFVGK